MHISKNGVLLAFIICSCLALNAQPTVDKKEPVVVKKKAVDSLAQEDAFEKQYQIFVLKTHINGIYIPKDLFDSFKQLQLLMDPGSIREFQRLPEERAAKKIYLVMWIAQNWHFRGGSRLSKLIRQLGITYPEHMAHFVVMTFHRHLNKKDLGIKERVTFYKEKEQEAFERAKQEKKGEVIFEEKRKQQE
jgi:hypothetical protein